MRPALALLFLILVPLQHAAAEGSPTDIADDAWSVRPLLPGAAVPAFSATAHNGETFHFKPSQRARPAVIVFYRGGWCPYCNLHFAELREIEAELIGLGMDLIFLSADSPQTLSQAEQARGDLEYHLLSDASMEIARKFGIAFRLPEAMLRRLADHGHDLAAYSGHDHGILPAPGVFIVAGGKVVFSYVNPDYKVRLSPDVLLAAARTMPGRALDQ